MKKLLQLTHIYLIAFLFCTLSCFACTEEEEEIKKEDVMDEDVMDKDKVDEDKEFKFEAGDYNISWEGWGFKTSLTATDSVTLTGRFCKNNSIDNCEDIGPITITRTDDENTVTFEFNDEDCRLNTGEPGPFSGNGTITEDNTYSFSVNGQDCQSVYTNNRVIFSKI